MSLTFTSFADAINNYKVTIAGVGATVLSLLLLRRWFAGGRYRGDARIDGSVVLITGANCGIGLETAKFLAKRGATVVLACRSEQRGLEAVRQVSESCGQADRIKFQQLDLASLQSVRDFAKVFLENNNRLDILVNNAGVMACPESHTEDGFETQFGVNHLGHFLLTNLLLPLLRATPKARVVTLSSIAHTRGHMHWDNINLTGEYSAFKAYGQSKLANVLFTNELAERLKDDDVTAYSVHPGAVQTNLGRHLPKILMFLLAPIGMLAVKTPVEGAQTTLHCALAPLSELVNGGYYSDCCLKGTAKQARSKEDAERLWKISEQLVGIS